MSTDVCSSVPYFTETYPRVSRVLFQQYRLSYECVWYLHALHHLLIYEPIGVQRLRLRRFRLGEHTRKCASANVRKLPPTISREEIPIEH